MRVTVGDLGFYCCAYVSDVFQVLSNSLVCEQDSETKAVNFRSKDKKKMNR